LRLQGRRGQRLCGIDADTALSSKNLDKEYQRLKAAGVDLVSDPVVTRFGNKNGAKFFCFKNPDATILELIEPLNG
jgi:hypothetical protein